jgi:signal transduction histidine kinase
MLTSGNILADRVTTLFKNIDKVSVITYITKDIKEESIKSDSRILIINKENKVLLDSHDTLRGTFIENEEINRSLQGETAFTYYNFREDGRVAYMAIPVTDRYFGIMGTIFISKDVNSLFDQLLGIINNVIYVSIIGALLTILVILVVSNVLSKPIIKLTEAVRQITTGKYSIKVDIEGKDELSNLGNAFNLMSMKLGEVDEQRAKFVSNVSHELRTPLASLKIISESLLMQSDVPISLVKEFLKDIDSEVDRLNKIIDSLLYLVSIENKELALDFKLTSINNLIDTILRRLKPLADKKNIYFIFDKQFDYETMLDQDRMLQALINIIGNAIKYTPNGGNIFVNVSLIKNMISIEVKDTGIGIPQKDIKYIFDRFYRVDDSRARASGGTGLGLSIALQIINLHKGEISVTSEENIGTSFIVMLPRNVGAQ